MTRRSARRRSRALIEDEAAAAPGRARARGVRRRRRAQDRAQGSLAVRGAGRRPRRARRAGARARASTPRSSSPTRSSRSPQLGRPGPAPRSRRPSCGRHDDQHGPGRADVRRRRAGADRRRAGAGRRRDARRCAPVLPGAVLEVTGGPNRPPLEPRIGRRCSPAPRRWPYSSGCRRSRRGGGRSVGRQLHRRRRHAHPGRARRGRRGRARRRRARARRRTARPHRTARAPCWPTCWRSRRTGPHVWCGSTMTSPEDRSSMASRDRSDARGAVDTRLDEAVQAADAAALRPGCRCARSRDLAELADVVGLFAEHLGSRRENPPVTLELLRALHQGRQLRRRRVRGRPAGRRVRRLLPRPGRGRAAQPHRRACPRAAGRSVGFALKLHQRAWALLRGVSEIAWTFDPLVSRNAYFNLVKLAARAGEYLPNFYGAMHDAINGERRHRPAARALAAARPGGRGRLRRGTAPAAVADELAAGAVVALGIGADGGARARRAGRRRPAGRRAAATSRRCARPTRRWPSTGGSRCARRSAGCSPTAAGRRIRPGRLVRRARRDRDEAHRRGAAPDRDAAGRAVPDVVRHQTARDILLLRVVTDEARGLGRVRGMADPLYSSEYVDGARRRAAPLPRARRWPPRVRSTRIAVAPVLAPFKGHRMAKAALEMARARRRAAGAGQVLRPRARRRARPGAVRRVGRDHGLASRRCSTPSAATSTRATSGSS